MPSIRVLRASLLAAASLTAAASLAQAADSRPIPLIAGHVTSVISGDTINVKLANATVRVALQGIAAPEQGQPGDQEATQALVRLVDGRDVQLAVIGQSPRLNVTIAVVYVDSLEVNETMVRQGQAWADRAHMRRKEDAILCIYEEEARALARGFWAFPVADRVPPWEWRDRKKRDSFTDYTDETAANCLSAVTEASSRAVEKPQEVNGNNKVGNKPKP